MTQCLGCPRGGLIVVTGSTWVGDLVLVRHLRRDESEGMCVHVSSGNTFRFDCRHVTGDALASRTALFMVSVLFNRRRARSVRRQRAMAVQAYFLGWLS